MEMFVRVDHGFTQADADEIMERYEDDLEAAQKDLERLEALPVVEPASKPSEEVASAAEKPCLPTEGARSASYSQTRWQASAMTRWSWTLCVRTMGVLPNGKAGRSSAR